MGKAACLLQAWKSLRDSHFSIVPAAANRSSSYPSLLGTYGWTTVESAPLQPELRKWLANSRGSLLGQGRAYPHRGQEPGSSKAGYIFAGCLPSIFALAVVRRTIHFSYDRLQHVLVQAQIGD